MKRILLFSVLFFLLAVHAVWGKIPQTISYQGFLADSTGNAVSDGTYTLTFHLYDSATDGTSLWSETQTVTVSNGLFNVILGNTITLNLAFDNQYWLGIKIGTASELAPRIALTSVPYSLNAQSVADSAITRSKIAGSQLVKSINSLTDDITLAAGTNMTITSSGDTLTLSSNGTGGDGAAWSLTGNSGTVDGTNFLGTTDSVAVNLRVNNTRALRVEPASDTEFGEFGSTPNLIGGYSGNSVTPGVVGATISGGGTSSDRQGTLAPNQVSRSFGTVGGGMGNTASNLYTTVGGGRYNISSGISSTVTGGEYNDASGSSNSTVAGGQSNTASGERSTVVGGDSNVASGLRATVVGGTKNTASGELSFAAGCRAMANHDGAFVWADSECFDGSFKDFVSTADNQFLIRASGGVGIGTTNPAEQLDVAGSVQMTGFKLTTSPSDGYVLTSDSSGVGRWQLVTLADSSIGSAKIDSGQVVKSINSLTDEVTLSPGTNVTITSSGDTITISASGTGGDSHSLDAADGDPTDVVFVDNDGNVGIGKSDPSEKLDVGGDIHASGTITSGSSIRIDGENDRITATGGTIDFDNENLVTTGAVGINTPPNPQVKLSVLGRSFLTDFIGTNIFGVIRLYENDTARAFLGYGSSGHILSNALPNSTSLRALSGGLHLSANNDALGGITVTTAGNVGIGTTNPGRKLDVKGTMAAESEGDEPSVRGSNPVGPGVHGESGNGPGVDGHSDSNNGVLGRSENGVGVFGNSGMGFGGFFASDNEPLDLALGGPLGRISTDPQIPNSNLILSSNNDIVVELDDNGDSDGVFRIKNSVKDDVCTVDEGGNLFCAGNLGIGTMTPSVRLEVAGELQANSNIFFGEDNNAVLGFNYPDNTFDRRMRITAGREDTFNNDQGAAIDLHGVDNFNAGRLDLVAGSGSQITFWTGINAQQRMVIENDGKVGIGTMSPAAKLHIAGAPGVDGIMFPDGTIQTTAAAGSSSRRWKKNINSIEGALNIVERLRGVSFDWKSNGKHDIGLIAEEVGDVIPEVVSYEENGKDAISVNYAHLVAVLIEAMKEQQNQIDKQHATIEALVERITAIEGKNRLTSN